MITKEDIEKAGAEYTLKTHPVVIGGSAIISEEEMIMFNRSPAFEAGAKWVLEKLNIKLCEEFESKS